MRLILAGLLILFGGALYGAPEGRTVAGTYQTEGGFEVTSLELLTNGTYTARIDLDIFPGAGRASGKWRLEGDEVILTPKNEEGRLKDHLRVMVIRTAKGRKMLLRKEDLKDDPSNPYACLYLIEGPNQSAHPPLARGQR